MPDPRTGTNPVEQRALARLLADAPAMPASDIVQLLLWPQTLADWARANAIAPAVAYNMLARFKPYRRVRELLAVRLEVPAWVLDHLIDAPRALPSSQRPASAPRLLPPDDAPPEPVTPTERLPGVRDGSNPLERRAIWHARREIAALPASMVVQLAIFPETLAEWARRRSLPAALVYSTLSGSQRNPRIRDALARRLDVAARDVDALIDGIRPEPRALQPPSPPLDLALPRSPAPVADGGAAEKGDGTEDAPPPPSDATGGDHRQLDLGL